MIIIGLTGGIGSGKSTVSRLLQGLGARVLDADKVGHQLYQPGTQAWQEVVDAFGPHILTPTREIDRGKLAAIVFNDPAALKKLNAIMHPRIFERIREILAEWRREGVKVAVVEAAVLIEAGWTPLVDQVWVTVAPEAAVVERLSQAKGFSPDQTRARIRSQLPVAARLKAAHQVIRNDGDLEQLQQTVKKLWQSLDSASGSSGNT